MSATHDELGDLAGPYVLGALSSEEQAAFEAHLAWCPACAAEVRGFDAVAWALARAAPPTEPPTFVRARILASVTSRLLKKASNLK